MNNLLANPLKFPYHYSANVTAGDGVKSTAKFYSKTHRENKHENVEVAKIANLLIESGKWMFLSNQIVSYWPLCIKTSYTDNLPQKYLNCKLPTCQLFSTLLYIFLNISYIIHYFIFKFAEDAGKLQFFDLILFTSWDLMVMVCCSAYRFYGIFKLHDFAAFWNKILNVVTQCMVLSNEEEVELKLNKLKRWHLKWFTSFLAFGLVDCSAVIYHYTFVSNDNTMAILMLEYLEIVICAHNSSALILIFFLQIFSYGFIVCKEKLEEIILTSQKESHTLFEIKRHENRWHEYFQELDTPNEVSSLPTTFSQQLNKVLGLVACLEDCVTSFNKLFLFSLLLEAVLGFWQVMFSMYFLHITSIDHFAFAINMVVPILTYPACLICLCTTASQVTVECHKMIKTFQMIPLAIISSEDGHKVRFKIFLVNIYTYVMLYEILK